MKKTYKVLAAISAALAGAGLLLCIAGFILGGKLENSSLIPWKEDSGNLRGGIFETVWEGSENENSDNVESLNVDIGTASLIMEHGDYDGIQVESDISGTKTKVWMEGSELNIKSRGRWLKPGKGGAVKVYLPEKSRFREVLFDVGAGSITVDRLEAEKITIDTGMGEFTGSGLLRTEALDCHVGMGDVYIEEADSRETYLDCSMGSLDIVMRGSWEDYYLTGECSLGDLSTEDDSWSLDSDIMWGNEDGDRSINAECSLGEIMIETTR
ncbi:MAG: hypothetical protein ACOX8E_03785 [Ruminococcus sp.]|jgi:hypothetical protein